MSRRRRGGGGEALNPWPGFVDALSTLLMVIIFVLLVFVLAQAFLSVALTGKDRALDQLNRQMAELTDMLSLERGHSAELQSTVAGLTRGLRTASLARDRLDAQVGTLTQQLADAAGRADAAGQAAAGQLADLARLQDQVRALTALRDDLEAQASASAAKSATADQAHAAVATQLADEQTLSESARAQIALMNRQMAELRAQVSQVSAALDLSEQADHAKDVQIANLGARLNGALASKVEELQRYRSEFFGRLREVLANRPGVQVVGDRFVFQSEVLFPQGSAELTGTGQGEVRALARTIKQVAAEIPPDLPWILRVDGHADRLPVSRGPFASNWELSSQRAINVVKLLITEGVPATHLAATGFADFQPLDGTDGSDADARNRRIELRLTDR